MERGRGWRMGKKKVADEMMGGMVSTLGRWAFRPATEQLPTYSSYSYSCS